MEKLKRKRTINRKAGSHDLFYATMASSLTKLNGEAYSYLRPTIHSVGAAVCVGGERFLHSDVAY
jgi:hypothetical protein